MKHNEVLSLLYKADPLYTPNQKHEDRIKLCKQATSIISSMNETNSPKYLYLQAWQMFIHSQTLQSQVDEIQFSLKGADYKLREALRLCENSLTSTGLLEVEVQFLLARVIFARLFILDKPPTESEKELEKTFQEVCKNLDMACKSLANQTRRSDKKDKQANVDMEPLVKLRAYVLYFFATVLEKWSHHRRERWEALCSQSLEKFNKCIECGVLEIKQRAIRGAGVLLLNWVNRNREDSFFYKRYSYRKGGIDESEKLFKDCVTAWESICRNETQDVTCFYYLAHAFHEYALYLHPSHIMLPKEQQFTYKRPFKIQQDNTEEQLLERIGTKKNYNLDVSLSSVIPVEIMHQREIMLEKAVGSLRNAVQSTKPVPLEFEFFLAQLMCELGCHKIMETSPPGLKDSDGSFKVCIEELLNLSSKVLKDEKMHEIADTMLAQVYLFWARSWVCWNDLI